MMSLMKLHNALDYNKHGREEISTNDTKENLNSTIFLSIYMDLSNMYID